jgi:lipopolysaccharide export system protein LptC
MTPMDRQMPDPLKLMRQQQAAEAKRLAAEQRQRSGLLKEQVKLREAERAEKAANEE